jgi:hypothetical protein
MKIINQKLLIAISLTLGLTLGLSVSANTQDENTQELVVSQSDVDTHNNMSDAKIITNSVESLEDWQDSFLEEFGIGEFGEYEGKVFVTAIQTVAVKNNDPRYGQYVDKAILAGMLQLQTEYAFIKSGLLRDKVDGDSTINTGSDANNFALDSEKPKKSKDDGFFGKITSLFDKKLDVADKYADIDLKEADKKLSELGVDAQEESVVPVMVTKNKNQVATIQKTIETAISEISGLTLVQTAINTDSTGESSIGLIAVMSDLTRQVANDISSGQKSIVSKPKKAKKVKEYLPKENKQYLGTMGTRLVWNENGSPVILSYGISSYRNNGSSSFMNAEFKKAAIARATTSARAQISHFVSGKMNVTNIKLNGQDIKDVLEREDKPGSKTYERAMKDVIEKAISSSSLKAKIKMQGMSPIKRWRYTDEKGHKFVGVVVAWKYSTFKAIKDFNSDKYKKPKVKNNENANAESLKKPGQKDVMIKSKIINSLDDF